MDTEHQLQLAQYVSQMRASGSNDVVIRQELQKIGWQNQDIDTVLPAATSTSFTPGFSANTANNTNDGSSYKLSTRPLIVIVAISVVVSGLIGIGLGFALKPDKVSVQTLGTNTGGTTQETYAKFTDKNYSFELAKSWTVDGKYTNGSTPVTFYSAEYNTQNTLGAGARIIVSYMLEKPAQDEIALSLASFTSSGVSYTIERDNVTPLANGGTKRIVEVTKSLKQQPGKVTRSIFVTIDLPDRRHFYLDATAEQSAWKERHNETINRMIDTFSPL